MKQILILLLILLILTSGCTCKEYAEKDVCIERGVVEEECISSVLITAPLLLLPVINTTGVISVSMSNMNEWCTNQISIDFVKNSSLENETELQYDYNYSGTRIVDKCIKTEKRMVCVK